MAPGATSDFAGWIGRRESAIDEITATPCGALSAMLDKLEHFGMGYSWGGFESLIIAYHPAKQRVATKFDPNATFLRLHIGLENPDDLIADLDAGFKRFREALKKAA